MVFPALTCDSKSGLSGLRGRNLTSFELASDGFQVARVSHDMRLESTDRSCSARVAGFNVPSFFAVSPSKKGSAAPIWLVSHVAVRFSCFIMFSNSMFCVFLVIEFHVLCSGPIILIPAVKLVSLIFVCFKTFNLGSASVLGSVMQGHPPTVLEPPEVPAG